MSCFGLINGSHKSVAGASEPLALVLQREYIDEMPDGTYRHVSHERVTEWPVTLLSRPRRDARTIPDFMAADAPPNRVDILRGDAPDIRPKRGRSGWLCRPRSLLHSAARRPPWMAATYGGRLDGVGLGRGAGITAGPFPRAARRHLSLGVLLALRRLGIRCPEEVSVLGFDDAEWAEVVSPPLSVVRQPVYEIGSKACTLLLDRIEGKTRRPSQHRHKGTLVEREPTAAPRLAVSRATTFSHR